MKFTVFFAIYLSVVILKNDKLFIYTDAKNTTFAWTTPAVHTVFEYWTRHNVLCNELQEKHLIYR